MRRWPSSIDPATEDITVQTYGGLKVSCERTAVRLHGAGGTTIVRPTYVIGPWDHSYRFTWWVERIARGGNVLAPGDPAGPIQVIDARDLGAWTVALAAGAVSGTFHAVSPAPPFGFGQMLETIAAEVAPPGTRLTWVDSSFLTAAGLDDETPAAVAGCRPGGVRDQRRQPGRSGRGRPGAAAAAGQRRRAARPRGEPPDPGTAADRPRRGPRGRPAGPLGRPLAVLG